MISDIESKIMGGEKAILLIYGTETDIKSLQTKIKEVIKGDDKDKVTCNLYAAPNSPADIKKGVLDLPIVSDKKDRLRIMKILADSELKIYANPTPP